MAGLRTRHCQVCRHPERVRIESLRAGGAGLDALAEKFEIERTAIWRHWQKHVSADLKTQYLVGPATLEELRDRAAKENGSLLDYLGIMRSVLVGQLVGQAEAGMAFGVATVSGRLIECLKEIGKITGEITRLNPSVNITNNIAILSDPRFLDLQTGLLVVARKHPEARADLIELVRKLDGRPDASPMIEGRAVA